ncbi:SCO5717 family growth-regulating ATPase, partial [Streptomyces sp. SR27]|uniref:SCO5717 family growth-regulating ATPase n=1 Tax=Streptomyces sp. SR27 TaxID=3076630 RepID=UPI00295B86E0
MNGDRDEIHGGWNPPADDQSDADSAEMTGEFTIDYTPPAWYTQNASGATGAGGATGGGGVALDAPGLLHVALEGLDDRDLVDLLRLERGVVEEGRGLRLQD